MTLQATNWDLFNTWHMVLPPSRPSIHHLKIVRYVAKEAERSAPVAVLGSTPEFRDLLAQEGFTDVYVLDKNPTFHAAMSGLRAYANREQFVQGDWLETLPQFKGAFELILSDLTMGNVHYQDRGRFYREIARSLRHSGRFVDKVLTHAKPNLRLDALMAKYASLPVNLLSVNHFNCEFLFCSELLDAEAIVDSTRFYRELEGRLTHPVLRTLLRLCPLVTPPECIWYYGRPWADVRTPYRRFLDTVEVWDDEPDSPYFDRLKVFAHVRKDSGI